MNVIGEQVAVLNSRDPCNVGRSGVVVLETAHMLHIKGETGTIRVEKAGSVFRVGRSRTVLAGEDIAGRLQDRIGSAKR